MIRLTDHKTLFVLLSTVSLFGLPAMASASNVCQMSDGFIEKGIGGTGHTDGVGTGGTGGGTTKIEGNGGIGGTGAKPRPRTDEKGLGGTGILAFVSGTIYKHGSICVNGLRITYNPQTPVLVNGRAATPDALKLGQHVDVYATPSGVPGELVAQSVKIDDALHGPIESLDPATSSLRIMGERLVVPAISDWSKFKVGDVVQVSGLRDQAGRIQASSLSLAETTSPESVKGPVRLSSDGQIFVGFTPIAASDATKNLKDGDTARITGAWSGQQLLATEVATENTLPLDKAAYISVEGYVKAATTDKNARIGAYTAPAASLTTAQDGQRVILSGYLDDNEKLAQEQLRPTASVPAFIDPPALNEGADKNAPHKGREDKPKKDDSKHDTDDDKANAAAAIVPHASGDEAHDSEHDTQNNADDKEDSGSDDKDNASGTDNHGTDGAETEQESEHNDDGQSPSDSASESDDSSSSAEHDSDSTDASDDSTGDTESHDATEVETDTDGSADADSATSESESADDQAASDDSSSDSSEDSSDHDEESDHESEHEED